MKYRHAYHAGNFADVHKHVSLVSLLRALALKEKGFLYLDTHAGRGLYDLAAEEARRSNEWSSGIGRLETSTSEDMDADIEDYLRTVRRLRTRLQRRAAYPGSPLLALLQLRAQDRAVLVESQKGEHRALREALRTIDSTAKTVAECADGFARLTAWLPPLERRALVLIDPPYEDAGADFRALRTAVQTALARLPNAVIAVWYPITQGHDTDSFVERLRRELPKPADGEHMPSLVSELWVRPRESPLGLNGSGLLVINPPWAFEQGASSTLDALHRRIDPTRAGGWQVR